MYRIYFNADIGKFVIQVLRMGLYWKTVRGQRTAADLLHEPLEFETFTEATSFVTGIGLDQLYQDRSENKRHNYMLLATH